MIFSVTNCELLVLSFVVKSGVFTKILSNIANPLHYNNVRPLLVWYSPESPDHGLCIALGSDYETSFRAKIADI